MPYEYSCILDAAWIALYHAATSSLLRYGFRQDLCCALQLYQNLLSLLCTQAYTEIEQKYVIESIFSQFMYKTLPTCNHLFVFKKQFCMQMALSGEICSCSDHQCSHCCSCLAFMTFIASHSCIPICKSTNDKEHLPP